MRLLTKKVFVLTIILSLAIHTHEAQYGPEDFTSVSLISDNIDAPGRMAIDNDDNIFLVDTYQRRVLKYNTQGILLTAIDTDMQPLSIAINSNGRMLVGDRLSGNIYDLASNGSKTLFYEGLNFPNAMVFGLNHVLYVTDSHSKRIVGIDYSGQKIIEFTHSEFVFPSGIAFDFKNNHIVVAEHGGIGEDMECGGGCSICWSSSGPQTSIYKFDLSGYHINTFGCFGEDEGLFHRIQGIRVGPCGYIYATDPYLGRVTVFDEAGFYVTTFGQHGDSQGELNLPVDIDFDSNNNIYIASANKGTIDVFSMAQALPTSTIVGTQESICAATSTNILVKLTGNGPWTFTYTIDGLNPTEITTSEANYNIVASEAGKYEIVSLTDVNNVSASCYTGAFNVLVSDVPPSADILTTNLSMCSSDETGIELQFSGTAPWTFNYTVDGLNPTPVTSNQELYTLNVEQSGLYEFFDLSDDACQGPSNFGSASVSINPTPIIELPDDLLICEGQTTELNPGVFDSYLWSDGSTSQTLTVATSGIYTVTVVDINGCSATASIEVSSSSVPELDLGTEVNMCEGYPIVLDPGLHNSYLWSDGSTSRTLEVGTEGMYSVTVTNENGCSSSDAVYVIVSSAPEANFYYTSDILEVQFINESLNADTHHWDFGDGNTSTTANPIHTYNFSGIYTVVHTVTNGCGNAQYSEVIEVVDDNLGELDKHFNKNKALDIYPNPSMGDFMVKLNPDGSMLYDIHVFISNSAGQRIFAQVYNHGDFHYYQGNYYIPISLNYGQGGTYFINVMSGNFNEDSKLLLKD